jgi:hypothetical protein
LPHRYGRSGPIGSNSRYRFPATGRSIRHPRESGNLDAFTPVNHPHKERDFGAFEHNGERIFSKIDYYDTTMTKGAKTQATRARPSGF